MKNIEENHLCDTCAKEFAVCDGSPTFGIDLHPDRVGAEADIVLDCPEYITDCPICGSTIVDGRCSDVGDNLCQYTVD